ncbi:hypothetical protein EDB89DRAFT_1906368 [Lactarius sanguifluus]|nr:hypothetical protein EDB89DRAFT_1906368 [Lactarius sanguifluus]
MTGQRRYGGVKVVVTVSMGLNRVVAMSKWWSECREAGVTGWPERRGRGSGGRVETAPVQRHRVRVETAPVYVSLSRACRGGVGMPVDIADVGGGAVEAVMGGDGGIVLGRGRVGTVKVVAWWRS